MRPQSTAIWTERRSRVLQNALMVVSLLFYLMYFLHPLADFPNHSPWQDWSKMTDEGWYAGGAIHYYVSGSWYQPETFNSAPALPVWPALLTIVFRLTGVSMAAARIVSVLVFGGALSAAYALMKKARPGLPAATALLLIVVNPLCYAFARLAILEPFMILWWMVSLCLAGCVWKWDLLRQVCLGGVFCALVLSKTTGAALIPAAIYLNYAARDWKLKEALRPILVSCAVAVSCWLAYCQMVMKSPYARDYRFLFTVNNEDHVVLRTIIYMTHQMLLNRRWIGPGLFDAGVAGIIISIIWLRELWKVPLFGASAVAVGCYLPFLVYHGKFEPRYYLPLVIPIVFLTVLGLTALWERGPVAAAVTASALLGGVAIAMAGSSARYMLHPEYSFLSAAQQIAAKVRSDSSRRQMLLSRSGGDIELFTSLLSVNDEFAPHKLGGVLDRYEPQWYAAWLPYEQPTVNAVGQRYQLVEVAHYVVFDDPARNKLVLYQLEPRK